MEEKVCALYGCDNPVTNWRMSCCCRSHQYNYAGKRRHGTENQPNVPLKPLPKEKFDRSSQKEYIDGYVVVKKKNRKYVTPTWADRKKIQEIYDEAVRISTETGVRHEVDHIVPLVHDLVCGLHVKTNLRIVTQEENRKKSNAFICEETIL